MLDLYVEIIAGDTLGRRHAFHNSDTRVGIRPIVLTWDYWWCRSRGYSLSLLQTCFVLPRLRSKLHDDISPRRRMLLCCCSAFVIVLLSLLLLQAYGSCSVCCVIALDSTDSNHTEPRLTSW